MRPRLPYLCLAVFLGLGVLLAVWWHQRPVLEPLTPSPTISIGKVVICPCYLRLSLPSRQELLDNVNRVVSITDILQKAYLSRRSNTMILKFRAFKAVVFSDLLRVLAADGTIERLREGEMVTVRGLLSNHPRYGLEVILRRPQDLVVGINA